VEWSFDSSYCLSVDKDVFKNGTKMHLWNCQGGSGQYFQFDTSSDSPSMLHPSAATKYCVVINYNRDDNGEFAQLWECDLNVRAQYWIRDWLCPSNVSPAECANSDPQTRASRGDSFLLRNYAFPDKCLVVDKNKGKNGQKVQLWSCDKATDKYRDQQTWKYYNF